MIMEKPIELRAEEFRIKINNLINDSGLPPILLNYIIDSVAKEVNAQYVSNLRAIIDNYIANNNEEKEESGSE